MPAFIITKRKEARNIAEAIKGEVGEIQEIKLDPPNTQELTPALGFAVPLSDEAYE